MRAAVVALLVSAFAMQAFAQEPPAPPAEQASASETAPVIDESKLSEEDKAYLEKARAFDATLTKRTGTVSLVDGKVSLNVPSGYYYLDAADARRVIVDAWGNPPDSTSGLLGMLFPAGANPMLNVWGATIEYANDGYVSDTDAAKIDYGKLLADMQRDVEAENKARVQDGYGALHLVGWAEPPTYDKAAHKMYWAEELQFNDSAEHTLNYRIRVLGREGVLVINFVSSIRDLAAIKQEAPEVMAIPSFTVGNTYADHAAGDRVAEYGLAGLVAGGLGVAAAKKFGLLALIAAFGKKFIVLIIAGLAALGGAVRKLFGGKREPEDNDPSVA